MMLMVFVLCLQLLEKVFPKAESLKAKLKDRFAAEEERRKAEEVTGAKFNRRFICGKDIHPFRI